MKQPMISIITITYNSEKTLEETIKSVISQKYDNLEYLIIDGGSKDKTLDIVKKYQDKISIVISEPDNGISDAFNKGIKNATGDIIGIINSDDIMLEGTLKSIAENYDSNVDVYSENIIIWDDVTNSMYVEKPDMIFSLSKISCHIAHQGRFITKTAYNKYGVYDTRLKYMMDADLLLRFYKAKAKFKYIDYTAAKFRLGATTSDDIKKKKNDVKIFVTNNGGGIFVFYYRWLCLYVRHLIKKILDIVCGEKFKRQLRYNIISNNNEL